MVCRNCGREIYEVDSPYFKFLHKEPTATYHYDRYCFDQSGLKQEAVPLTTTEILQSLKKQLNDKC